MDQITASMTIIRDQKFGKTFNLGDPTQVYTFQQPYLLDEKDYIILTKTHSSLATYAHTILGGATLIGFGVFAKYFHSIYSKQPSKIEEWELISLLIAFIISGLLLGIGALLPNDKKQLLKKIKKHFKENERMVGALWKK